MFSKLANCITLPTIHFNQNNGVCVYTYLWQPDQWRGVHKHVTTIFTELCETNKKLTSIPIQDYSYGTGSYCCITPWGYTQLHVTVIPKGFYMQSQYYSYSTITLTLRMKTQCALARYLRISSLGSSLNQVSLIQGCLYKLLPVL